MSTERNKELTKRFVEEVLNTGDFSATDEWFAPDYVEHSPPPGFPYNRQGVEMAFSMLHSAFPDFTYVIEDAIAADDRVVLRMTGYGTMQGALMGRPPTGKHASWAEIHIVRWKDGKLIEHWDVIDQLS